MFTDVFVCPPLFIPSSFHHALAFVSFRSSHNDLETLRRKLTELSLSLLMSFSHEASETDEDVKNTNMAVRGPPAETVW